MKAISIRSLRQHWPEAEALLQREEEILITRRSKPVAKLVLVHQEKKAKRRKRWDPNEHARWLKKIWGNKVISLADKYVQADREDRLVQTSK